MQTSVNPELDELINTLPPQIQEKLRAREDVAELLEVVLDLGRVPEARYLSESHSLSSNEVTEPDIEYVVDRISPFGDDNRAGIERTLHRISAVRNRAGRIIGLTLRVGRAVYGTIRIIEDLVLTGRSVLLLGKPGVGKTTMLREVARVLADSAQKRVIVVDTSNEIAGDGDIPHPGIGRARRMQVPSPPLQHGVMIEAVENHMPEVIVIDEIGTELEATAARTIAERGVQLVATAHGNTLENLIMNPTLSDLVGGVHTVTLGDVEARRRRTQKTVLERRAPPTFDVLVEIQGWNDVSVHADVSEVVDRLLRGFAVSPERRALSEDGTVSRTREVAKVAASPSAENPPTGGPAPSGSRNGGGLARSDHAEDDQDAETPPKTTHILPYGVNKGKLQQAVRGAGSPVELVADIGSADLLLTTKNFYRRRTQALRTAEQNGKPVYVLRKNTLPQIEQFVQAISRASSGHATSAGPMSHALSEAERAAAQIERGASQVDLNPQGAYVRHLQHQIAEKYGLNSASTGRDPTRHVVIFRR